MTYRKKLIEVALPLEAINVASAREKSIRHGHPSTLHLWWARRPLAAARAVIFTSLVDDPDDPNALPAFVEACKQLPIGTNVKTNGDTPRMRLFDFIEQLVTWEATTDEDILNTARELIQIATEGNPPPLLDPFAGGGSIPLEAQRLGLEAHASDLNPVAVMINKAQIEIPPRFADRPPVNPRDREKMFGEGGKADTTWTGASGLAADVRYYGEWMREKAFEKIGHLYPTHNGETVIAWLWARTVKCPNPACGSQMSLVSSFDLSKKKGKRAWIVPHPDKEAKKVHFEVQTGDGKTPEPPKVGRGAKFKCLVCDETAPDQHIKDEGMADRMGAQLMAIVTDGQGRRNYHSPTSNAEALANSAKPKWFPTGELADEPRAISCKLYGLIDYADLFTPRQLVALTTFSDLVHEAREQAYTDAVAAGLPDDDTPLREGGRGALAYAEAVSVYLGMNVSKQSNRASSMCFWDNRGEKVQQVFARQAIPMNWDYTEGNPFSTSSGNFLGQLEYMMRVVENLPADVQQGTAIQQDAAQLDLEAHTLSMDPPYFDLIGYADLSDFFYIWMRPNLRHIYPDIFGTMLVPKEPELIASPYRHGGKEAANQHYESGMSKTFKNIRKFVVHDYPISIYYAFKQQDSDVIRDGDTSEVASTGWETMLTSLIEAGFSIDGTWPIRSELTGNLKKNVNALASSIILVCRPRPDDAASTSRRAFVNDLRRELPRSLKEMQSGNIAPVDLAQSSIGPGMAIYSRYSKVLEADGSSMSVRTALGLINQVLDETLSEQDGDIDADTRFAVAWFTQFGFEEGDFGQADVLARGKNTSVAGVEAAGVVDAGRGKVKLKHWSGYDPGAWDPTQDKRPTVWEATHHLIERLNSHGEAGSALLLNKMPSDMAAEARQLAYRLYSICERKNWADHARDYNALVVSWSGIGEVAAQQREATARGDATEQMNLFDD